MKRAALILTIVAAVAHAQELPEIRDIYATDGPSIWTREGEKVANPNAFTSDW